MTRKVYEQARPKWGKGFRFAKVTQSMKKERRMDPNVGSLTRLRDDIRERQHAAIMAELELPPETPLPAPHGRRYTGYKEPTVRDIQNWGLICKVLREEPLPIADRRSLEQRELAFRKKWGLD